MYREKLEYIRKNLKPQEVKTSKSGLMSFVLGMREVWYFGLPDRESNDLLYGWGNGYIVVPKTHPFAKMTSGEVSDIVGEEITMFRDYSDDIFSFDTSFIPSLMGIECKVIGFDTCHCYNNMENSSREKVLEKTQFMLDRAEEWIGKEYLPFGD